jgi:ribosome-binding factor A
VTGVEITPDLQNATVYVSVLGSDTEGQAVLAGLRHATGFLRRELGATLALRVMPQLVFQLDRSVQNSMRIEQLLDSLKYTHTASGDDSE